MAKTKILFVDDEDSILDILSARMKSWGYEVKAVSNGKDALETIKADRPDIVVLDYMMPGMDGVETLRRIRKTEKDLPVIMFTAYPDQRSIQGADDLGVSAYVPKLSVLSEVHENLKSILTMIEKKLTNKT